MIERREQLCFALEARDAVGIGRESIRENFQRDVAIEPRIARAIHLAHAARAESRHPAGTSSRRGRSARALRLADRAAPLPAFRESFRHDRSTASNVSTWARNAAVGPAGLREVRLPLGAVARERSLEHALHARPVIELRHRLLSSLYSHSFAVAQSRFTVAGEMPSASAVSSTDSPAKNLSSTTRPAADRRSPAARALRRARRCRLQAAAPPHSRRAK